jgi:hypothetical protein
VLLTESHRGGSSPSLTANGFGNINIMAEFINKGHYLELMDRLHVVMCTLNDHCLEHPLSQSDEDIKFKIEYAIGQLWEAYQLVGQKEDEYENENNAH